MINDQKILLHDFHDFLVLCHDIRKREDFRIDLSIVIEKEDKRIDDDVYIRYFERIIVIYATLSLQFAR